ncbi:MAG: Ldh family oxidoreductase [Clostridia bacterium]|nr:Ldh family oxidoreductase [Clostridia bacterium]
MDADRITVSRADAQRLAVTLLRRAGVPREDAETTAESLLLAEMSGMPSHGLMRLKPTLERLGTGEINPRPDIRCERTAANILRYDADGALGQVAGTRAMRECIAAALQEGSAFAAVRRAFHFGAIGFYTGMAADKGLLAFMCTNSSPQMAPWGGMDKALGTNPFALAFPAGDGSFSLDISTAAAARGKIRLAAREGREIPAGWAMDENGRDTTDAGAAMRGTVLPMAGHKGYGMAMAVDYLSAALTGADFSYEASNMFEGSGQANTGCFMAVLDPDRFAPKETRERRVKRWLDRIRSSRPRPGCDSVRVPGDTRNRLKAHPPRKITLLRDTWEEVLELEQSARPMEE